MESSGSGIARHFGSRRLRRYVYHDADYKTQDQARKIYARYSIDNRASDRGNCRDNLKISEYFGIIFTFSAFFLLKKEKSCVIIF